MREGPVYVNWFYSWMECQQRPCLFLSVFLAPDKAGIGRGLGASLGMCATGNGESPYQ